jgi:CheY-like chemotaxis protein
LTRVGRARTFGGASRTRRYRVAQSGPQTMTTPLISGRLRGVRILLVVGNAEIRDLLVTIVKLCGGYPLAVATSSAACAALAGYRPDTLLITLPLTDPGYRLMRQAAVGGVPVVAFDDDRGHLPSAELFAAGFSPHVVKRLHMDDISEAVLAAIAT